MYVGYVKQIVDLYSDPEATVNSYASLIRDSVKNDPRSFFTYDVFESNISKSANGLQVSENNNGWNFNNGDNNGWNFNNGDNGGWNMWGGDNGGWNMI